MASTLLTHLKGREQRQAMIALACSESLCSFPAVIYLLLEENLYMICTILIIVMSAGLPCITSQLRLFSSSRPTPELMIRECSSSKHRKLSQHEKFRKAAVLTSELASVISVSSNVYFQRRIYRGVSRKLSREVLNYRRALARAIFLVTPPYFVTTPSILLVDGCNVKCKKPN